MGLLRCLEWDETKRTIKNEKKWEKILILIFHFQMKHYSNNNNNNNNIVFLFISKATRLHLIKNY